MWPTWPPLPERSWAGSLEEEEEEEVEFKTITHDFSPATTSPLATPIAERAAAIAATLSLS